MTHIQEIQNELSHAIHLHPPLASLHEAYAVILEELDELWDQVRAYPNHHDPKKVRKELVQIGAMALRALRDLDARACSQDPL